MNISREKWSNRQQKQTR